MDPSVKNLREWVGLLFFLFCALDIAGVQYGMMLAEDAPLHPNPLIGQIEAIVQGPRGAWYNIYVTTRQLWIFHGLLAAAALSLLATLTLIVAHGVRHVRATRDAVNPYRRKR
ncbi:MAG: hypothetical protein JWM91_4702 [Rhodospirillales bacterium]|nr:hypothetical protein [Rhodospirillales bacterium]